MALEDSWVAIFDVVDNDMVRFIFLSDVALDKRSTLVLFVVALVGFVPWATSPCPRNRK